MDNTGGAAKPKEIKVSSGEPALTNRELDHLQNGKVLHARKERTRRRIAAGTTAKFVAIKITPPNRSLLLASWMPKWQNNSLNNENRDWIPPRKNKLGMRSIVFPKQALVVNQQNSNLLLQNYHP